MKINTVHDTYTIQIQRNVDLQLAVKSRLKLMAIKKKICRHKERYERVNYNGVVDLKRSKLPKGCGMLQYRNHGPKV